MEKANLQVVRFNAEDVIATSNFAVPGGIGYTVYSGVRSGNYTDGYGYKVFVDGTVGEYTTTDFDENVSGNIAYANLFEAYQDGSDIYTYAKLIPANKAIAGGQGAANTPGENPPFVFP